MFDCPFVYKRSLNANQRLAIECKRIACIQNCTQFLDLTHVIKRPSWYTQQWQTVAQVLDNNRIKFFRYLIALYTNIATVTSRENRELDAGYFWSTSCWTKRGAPTYDTLGFVHAGLIFCKDEGWRE